MSEVTGTFTGTGQSASFVPAAEIRRGRFNVSLWGTFSADVRVERSFDGGTTWVPLAKPDLTPALFDEPISFAVEETEGEVLHRLNCTTYTSGTVNYRMSR